MTLKKILFWLADVAIKVSLVYFGLHLGNSVTQNFLLFYVAVAFVFGLPLLAAGLKLEAIRRTPDFKKYKDSFTGKSFWYTQFVSSVAFLLCLVAYGWWGSVAFYSIAIFGAATLHIAIEDAIARNASPEQKRRDDLADLLRPPTRE